MTIIIDDNDVARFRSWTPPDHLGLLLAEAAAEDVLVHKFKHRPFSRVIGNKLADRDRTLLTFRVNARFELKLAVKGGEVAVAYVR
jgi:hypothetical protein